MKKAALQKQIPVYNPNLEPLIDINAVKRRLPHRYPFLMVDKVIHLDEKSVVGIKNVTTNEPFFTGHFPEEPVMPGVLQIEAAAQVGGILVLGTVPDPENYSSYFLKIDKVKFKRKVVPGDTLIIKVDLLEPIRRGIAIVFAEIFVGNQLVMEGELMAQIVKNKNDD
jgi:UDP-3-O-[3-hydroxymyristoyl] N-acetylglucosamine deacetylase/3-hydroxyacyl-[acyl-carrier-protein] dehydratase